MNADEAVDTTHMTLVFEFSGPYGHGLLRTPNLDRLAAEGSVFDNA